MAKIKTREKPVVSVMVLDFQKNDLTENITNRAPENRASKKGKACFPNTIFQVSNPLFLLQRF